MCQIEKMATPTSARLGPAAQSGTASPAALPSIWKTPSGSWNHRSALMPKTPSTWFAMPYCGWKIQRNADAAATVDVTYGR